MRSAIFAAPFLAAAYAQKSSSDDVTLIPVVSGSTTITKTYTYSNPNTKYTDMTNSNGVITGMPGQSTVDTGLPAAFTSQPAVATIPAGEPTGYHTLTLNISAQLTSFTISVGKSTTAVLGGADVSTVEGSSVGASQTGGGQGPRPHRTGGAGGSRGTGTAGGQQASSASASASASSSGAAQSNMKVASAGMLGLGALFAALL